MRLDEDGHAAETAEVNDGEQAQLCDDMRSFGQLVCVKRAADSICEVQGR